MTSPCKNFAQGHCAFGNACRFVHATATPASPSSSLPGKTGGSPVVMCPFFLKGSCSFGSACRKSHQAPSGPAPKTPAILKGRSTVKECSTSERRIDPSDGMPRTFDELSQLCAGCYRVTEIEEYWRTSCTVVGPDSTASAIVDTGNAAASASQGLSNVSSDLAEPVWVGSCSEQPSNQQPLGVVADTPAQVLSSEGEDTECGICFESIRARGQRFGILENCDHAFCLECIRSWRKQKEQQDRRNLRMCPVCRNESFFVVPCDRLISDSKEKAREIAIYKSQMSATPCQAFDYGNGSCPFGTSCFYAHLNPDGTRHVPAPPRRMFGADGSQLIGEVKLSDFLD